MKRGRVGCDEFRQLIEGANSIILRLDTRGFITYMNRFGLEFFGYDEKELIGRSVLDTIVPRTDSSGRDLASMIERISAHPERYFRNENENRRKDGRRVWVDWTNTGLFNARGRLTGLLCLGSDLTERRRTEEQLERAQSLLEAAIDQSPSGILIADAPKLTIRYANRAAHRILGRTELPLVGIELNDQTRSWRVYQPDGRTPFPDQMIPLSRAVLEGAVSEGVEAVIRRDDGQERWVSINAAPIRDREGVIKAGIVVFHDITDRKTSERELRESQRLLRTILDTISVRVFWKDLDLKYLGGNRAFALDAGLSSPEELVGLDDYQMVWAEQAEQYRKQNRRIIETGQPILNLDEPQTALDGGPMWVRVSVYPLRDDSGRTTGVLGTYEDVTEHRRAEQALRQAKEEWERTFDAVPDLIAIVDQELRLLRVNRAMAEALGRRPEDCIGQLCHTLLHRTPLPLELCPGRQSLADGQIHRREVYEERLDRYFSLTTVPLPDEQGRFTRILQLAQDVTAAKRAEQERRRLEDQMLHAQKLESLGVLAGGIAHDFNNLLMAMLGHAELALQDLSASSRARDNVVQIGKACRRAAELTRQMLAYAGRGHFEVRAVDLDELVREMAHILQVSVTKKAALRFRLAETLPSVEADASQLRQVILNLITNASEAIGDQDGTITVATGQVQADRALLEQTWIGSDLREGPYVWLEVSDTGCGMDRETLGRIFDPFFTTKFAGRGLGLAAVLGIVRGHRGAIRVSSEPGRGTSFKVLLPASELPAEKPPVQPPSGFGWRASGTALLVDDEELVRHVGGRLLERLGFRVLLAADGLEALELLKTHAEKIACAVVDLTMPRMDGIETVKAMRAVKPDLRVLLSSGYEAQELAGRLAADRLSGFIQKPYELADFASRLRELLER